MIAAAVNGVLAQRLIRRICTDCTHAVEPSANQIAWLAACRPRANLERQTFYEGAGCTFCNLTGYRGRIAVYEILEIDRALADCIRRGDLEAFIAATRVKDSYVPLVQSAIDLALAGTTSLAEVMAVGSGLEELVDTEITALSDAAVDNLLELQA
jgi:MSHA biogenesis protein MshE